MSARAVGDRARKMNAAIGQENFGLADAAGIENDLAGCRIAGVVFKADTEIEIAERHPYALAAPAHMDRLALERHRAAESRAGLGRQFLFEASLKREISGMDDQLAHSCTRDLHVKDSLKSNCRCQTCPKRAVSVLRPTVAP